MLYIGKQSYKSIAKFKEIEQIVTAEFHCLLKFPHWYQQQQLRD